MCTVWLAENSSPLFASQKRGVFYHIPMAFQGLCLNGLYHGGISKLYGVLTGGELDYWFLI